MVFFARLNVVKKRNQKAVVMKMNDNSRKKFLALLLSLTMATSTVIAFASCDDETSSSTDDTKTEEPIAKDAVITNGDFETFDNKNGLNPIVTSMTGWSGVTYNSTTSGNAISSKSASGIVDVADKAWDSLTTSALGETEASKLTEEQASESWKDMTVRDKLEYYKAWKDNDDNDDRKISDLKFYQSFNIDDEDLPLVKNADGAKVAVANPRTHDFKESEGYRKDENGQTHSKVLMVHNNYYNSNYENKGTAQKTTSSTTVTVKAGTSAQFSLWVKTSDITGSDTYGNVVANPTDAGAFITVTHSIGGNSLDPLEIKNINTAGVTENNGWVQYEFLLKGSYYADTTFTVVLGLGQGGGTDTLGYVNGYAFFDDLVCETISNDTFDTSVTDYESFDLNAPVKEVNAFDDQSKKFALNFYGSNFGAYDILNGWNCLPTTDTDNSGVKYTSVESADIERVYGTGSNIVTYPGIGFDTDNDVAEILSGVSALNSKKNYLGENNKFAQAAYDDYFKEDKFISQNEKVLLLLSSRGAAYTAKSPAIKVAAGDRVAISFFVKTSDMGSFTGANVTLRDGKNVTTIGPMDTTAIAGTTVGDTDIHDGWQQCLFFIHNETDAEREVSFTFTFGPTAIEDTTKASYHAGFAAFAKFEQKTNMSEAEFDCAGSGSYSKVVTLSKPEKETTSDTGFDSATNLSGTSIENGYATPKTYRGVFSGSAYVSNGGKDLSTNAYPTAGLLNKEHEANYSDILAKLATAAGTNANWNDIFGSAAKQPLVIYNGEYANAENTVARTKAYGFFGSDVTIAANTYKAISLRVKVSAGANAYVYLTDVNGDSRENSLSIGRNLTYWYDKDGNVCASDPTAKDFDSDTDVAFKLQSNGLYTVNTKWSGAADYEEGAYYANLAAYEKKGDHLAVANGVSYEYSDLWQHVGNDGIAFYNYDETNETAYAYPEQKTPVKQLPKSIARYTAIDGKALQFKVAPTGDDWAIVTFYVHTGSVAKNYRLEVWSGSRDGDTSVSGTDVNPNGTFVAFDSWQVTDPTDANFKTMSDALKEKLSADQLANDYFESAFSFYDTNKYLRYDESVDENGVENSYDDYDATDVTTYPAQKASTAYLRFESEEEYTTFADYATLETTVNTDPAETEDDDTDDSTTTETSGADVWLLVSSIVVAVALLFAVVSLIVRKMIAKSRKNRGVRKNK